MPLDLPPPLPPQQAEVAVLEERHGAGRGDGVITLEIDDYSLLISGNTYLDEARIREVTSVAKTPSQAILLLNALYPAEGHMFVNVQYARDRNANTIYVRVNEGYLAEADVPPAMAPFFEHFEGERGVKESDLEPQRVLAELKAERAGYRMSSHYSIDEDDPAAFTLVMDGREDPEHETFEFTGVFGNPGNRFLGRYFGAANMKAYAPNGDELGLGYTTAFVDMGNPRNGESYDRYDASYNTVNSFGLYSVSAAYTDYEVTNLLEGDFQDREEAEIVEGRLQGNQFLYADGKTRIVLEEEISYIDSAIEIVEGMAQVDNQDDGGSGLLGGLLGDLLRDILGIDDPAAGTMVDLAGQTIQDEEYGTARLGASISHTWELFDREGNINFGAGYRQGFGGEIDNGFTDPERTADFGLYDAELKIDYRLPADLIASFRVKGQHADGDRLPQQQQWVLGGPDNLSAFLPGILFADTGVYGRFQLQLPRWKVFTRPYRLSFFVEGGTAEFEGPNPPVGREGRESASDAGVKLEFAPFDNVTLTAYAADGLATSDIPEERVEDAESDVYFNLKATF